MHHVGQGEPDAVADVPATANALPVQQALLTATLKQKDSGKPTPRQPGRHPGSQTEQPAQFTLSLCQTVVLMGVVGLRRLHAHAAAPGVGACSVNQQTGQKPTSKAQTMLKTSDPTQYFRAASPRQSASNPPNPKKGNEERVPCKHLATCCSRGTSLPSRHQWHCSVFYPLD